MRRILAVAVLAFVFVWAPAAAQESRPVRIAGHVTGTMFDGPFDNMLLGARVLIPVGNRVDVYPSVSRRIDGIGGVWQVSLALQWRPFGSPERTPIYFGVGWLAINDGRTGEGFDVWASGVEVPSGRLRPFAELQFLGPLHWVANPGAGVGVQAQFGMSWATR